MPRISLLAPSLNLEGGAGGDQPMGTSPKVLLKVLPHGVSSTVRISPGAGAGCPPGLGPPPSPPCCWGEQEPKGGQGGLTACWRPGWCPRA